MTLTPGRNHLYNLSSFQRLEETLAQEIQVTLADALASYWKTRRKKEDQSAQQELSRFVRWCGREQTVESLTPLQVEEYCTSLERAGERSSERIAITKGLLTYCHRQGWTKTNLASHARLRRSGSRGVSRRLATKTSGVSRLTSDGYQQLEAELATLKAERGNIIEEIRLAAATKDFSENAPLDAAREHQGQVEARIRGLEQILKGAEILDSSSSGNAGVSRVTIGSRVTLRHSQTAKEFPYILVESSEADPSVGKLSASSPIGQAILNRIVGDEVEVTTPRGVVKYIVAKMGS